MSRSGADRSRVQVLFETQRARRIVTVDFYATKEAIFLRTRREDPARDFRGGFTRIYRRFKRETQRLD